MNGTFMYMKRQFVPLTYQSWLEVLHKPISKRPLFHKNKDNKTVQIGQVIVRFLGVPADEEDYYTRLYEYVHGEGAELILLSGELLDQVKLGDTKDQRIYQLLSVFLQQNRSINELIEVLNQERLLLHSRHPILNNVIHTAFYKVLQKIEKNETGGLNNQNGFQVLTELIQWSFHFLKDLIIRANPLESLPKFMWYGDYAKNHEYFIHFIMELGCDLVVFSPNGKDILSSFDPGGERTLVHKYPFYKAARPFPTEKSRRKSTVAYRASKEIEEILSGEGAVFYKKWQLRDHIPVSITLKTTYDELFILQKELAMIRPGFSVNGGKVRIPSLFAKIQGVSGDRREYWNRMHSLVLIESTLFIRQLPFSRNIDNDLRFHYRETLDKDGLLNPEKMLRSRYWKYKQLPTSLQKGIACAIRHICAKPALKAIYKESLNDIRVYLFTQVMQLRGEILKLLQKFDYSQEVPKIVIYNNGLNGVLTRSDAAALLLLNQIGTDIVIYNPGGLNDIENYIDEDLYDIHWLEDVVDEQEYKEPSFFKKLYYQELFKLKKGRLRP